MAKNAKKLSKNDNVIPYTITQAIHEVLLGTDLTGRAESGFISALFNDDEWQAKKGKDGKWNYPWLNYWNAPPKNTDKKGNRIIGSLDTRAQLANTFLLRFDEYSKVAAEMTTANTAKLAASKAKNETAETAAKHAVTRHKKKIDAAHSMFNRAMQSIYLLRSDEVKAVKVTLGANNSIDVVASIDPINNSGSFKAAALRSRGLDMLKKANKVDSAPRGARGQNGTPTALSSVDTDSAKPLLSKLVDMVTKDNFVAPIDSEKAVDQNDLAETALAFVRKIDPTNGDAELRGTLSQLIVAIMPMVGVKTLDAAQKIASKAVNA